MSSEETDDLGFELPAPAKSSRATVIAAFAVDGRRRCSRSATSATSTRAATSPRRAPIPSLGQGRRRASRASCRATARSSCPAPRTRSSRRRSIRARPATCGAGSSTSATRSRTASCSPRSTRPTSTLSSHRRAPSSRRPRQRCCRRRRRACTRARTRSDTRGSPIRHLVAQQTVDQDVAQASTDKATVAANQANVVAQQANVQRLVELTAFSKVYAPFAGTITARTIDRGDARHRHRDHADVHDRGDRSDPRSSSTSRRPSRRACATAPRPRSRCASIRAERSPAR